MSIDDKWADRVFRAPKSGSDYTSSRIQTQRRDAAPDTLKTSARAAIEPSLLERQKSEIADMQLVINQLVRRIDHLEDSPLDDRIAFVERRVKRLEIFVLVLSSALIIAVIMKVLNVMGIDLFSILANF
jgi:hypothetical protein